MDNTTIVRCLRGISRPEVLERIYNSFPLVDPLGVWVSRKFGQKKKSDPPNLENSDLENPDPAKS